MISDLTRSDGGSCRPAFLAAIAAAFALLVGMVGILPAGASVASSGTVKVDGEDIGGPGNQPHEACGLQVTFYGFSATAHDVTVTWTSKDTGDPVITTPSSGAGTTYHFTGNGSGGSTADASFPFALHTAGLTFGTQGYHVTLEVDVDGAGKSKTIFVGACAQDVGLQKSALPTSVSAGQTVTYTLTATNHSPQLEAVGFQITDPLPSGFTLTSVNASSTLWDCQGTAVDCTYRPSSPPIPVGGSISFTVTGVANGTTLGTMTNTAHLDPNDDDLTNNTATADVTVTGVTDTANAPTIVQSECVNGAASTPTYTIVATTGIVYKIGTTVVSGGPHDATAGSTITVTATATAAGHTASPASFQLVFDAAPTDCSVAGDQPTIVQSVCANGAATTPTYTIPTTAGIEYLVGGSVVAAGQYDAVAGTTVVVTVHATAAGHVGTPPTYSLVFDAAPTDCSVAGEQPSIVQSTCVRGAASTPTYTIPTTAGIEYLVGGSVVAAGQYDAVAGTTVVVTVHATAAGHVGTPPTYSLVFDAAPTDCTVTAAAPTITQSVCDDGSATTPTYTIVDSPGITYTVGGDVVTGTNNATAGSSVVVTATATATGHAASPASFTLDFDDAPTDCTVTAAQPTVAQSVCDGETATTPTYTIVATPGIEYSVDGEPVTGTNNATPNSLVVVTATATEPGHAASPSTFYLYFDPAPVCEHPSATVTKTNNANGDEEYSVDETATSVAHDVSFKLHITNTSPYAVNVTGVTDSVDEGEGTPVECAPALTLAVDASGDCFFTMPGYSPADGGVKSDVATVFLSQVIEQQQEEVQLQSLRIHTAALFAAGLSSHITSNTSTVRTHVPVIVIPGVPDLSIDKTGPPGVSPGSLLSYAIVAKSIGSATSPTAVITDDLPAGLTFVSASGTGFSCTGTAHLVCTHGPLAPGDSATVNVVARLASDYTASTVVNTAVVGPTDATPANNTSTFTTPVTINDLGVSKTGPGSAHPGDELVYAIDVTNVSGSPATGFTVTDVVPAGLTVSFVTGSGFGCTVNGQTITCTYAGTLAVGAKASISVRALLDASFTGTSVANTAVVDPGRPDSNAGDNSSTATTTVVPLPISGGGGGPAVAPSPAPVSGGDGGGALPFTGLGSLGLLQGGVALLVLGLLMALIARRRRTISD